MTNCSGSVRSSPQRCLAAATTSGLPICCSEMMAVRGSPFVNRDRKKVIVTIPRIRNGIAMNLYGIR